MSAPDINSENYYKVLGVDKSSTEKEIKRAYRKLAREHHPDQNPDDREAAEERFKAVGEAYGVLSDAQKRKTYNQFGKQGLQGGQGGGFSSMDAHKIFEMFMGGGMGGPGGFPGGGNFTFNVGGPGGGFGRNSGMGGMGGFPFGEMFGGNMGGMGGHHFGQRGPRMQRQQRQRKSPIPAGSEVYLHNLNNGNFNAKQGRIQSFNGERFSVDIEGIGLKNIKPENICQVISLEIHSLQYEQLNGSTVRSVGYTEGCERVRCLFSNGQIKNIKPMNLKIPNGTTVRVDGLQNAQVAQLNGRFAKVLSWLADKGRYEIKIQNTNKTYKMKPENARL